MSWFKKKLHKLPKFPAEVAKTFWMLCELLDAEQIELLRKAIDVAEQDFLAEAEKGKKVDIQGVEAIVANCRWLLDNYEHQTDDNKKLIVGAVRYFAAADDPFSDDVFSTGLFDDMKVLNFVLEELGVEGRFLVYS